MYLVQSLTSLQQEDQPNNWSLDHRRLDQQEGLRVLDQVDHVTVETRSVSSCSSKRRTAEVNCNGNVRMYTNDTNYRTEVGAILFLIWNSYNYMLS